MTRADEIVISVPGRPDSVRIVRSVANSVAAGARFGYDRIEDLGLALSEACGFVIETGTSDFTTRLRRQEGGIDVVVSGSDGGQVLVDWHSSLSRVVLESVASNVENTDGAVSFTVEATSAL